MVILGLIATAWAGSLSGTIQGADGGRIAAATIYAINPGLQAAQTTSDIEGSYSLRGLPPGDYRLWVVPTDGDPHVSRYYPSASSYCDGELIKVGMSDTRVDLTLPMGNSVHGRLVDQHGAGVQDVRVRGESESGATPRACVTNTDGTFQLDGLEPGLTWKLQASKSGLPTQWWGQSYERSDAQEIDTNADQNINDWVMMSGINVSGQISGPNGPVPSATVRVYSSRQLVQTVSDLDGWYEATGLPPGDVTAWAEAPGLATTYLPDSDRPAESVTALEEQATLSGLDIHMPYESTLALMLQGSAPRTDGDLSGLTLMLYNDTQTVARAGVSDSDGYVEWGAIHGGEYKVLVYGGTAGHPDDWLRTADGGVKTYRVEPESDHPGLEVQLPLANTLEGVVVDEDDQPIAGALVVITPTDTEDTGQHDSSDAIFIETTNAQGEFSVVGVPEGLWDVRSQVSPNCDNDPGYVTTYWPSEEDPLMASPIQINLSNPVDRFRFILATDNDHDQMSDRWERRYDLDTERDDADEDPDNDGLSNLVEFRMRTDPLAPEGYWEITRTCGCTTHRTDPAFGWVALLLLALIRRRDAVRLHTQAPLADQTSTDNW